MEIQGLGSERHSPSLAGASLLSAKSHNESLCGCPQLLLLSCEGEETRSALTRDSDGVGGKPRNLRSNMRAMLMHLTPPLSPFAAGRTHGPASVRGLGDRLADVAPAGQWDVAVRATHRGGEGRTISAGRIMTRFLR